MFVVDLYLIKNVECRQGVTNFIGKVTPIRVF